jgi:hypothetical protein
MAKGNGFVTGLEWVGGLILGYFVLKMLFGAKSSGGAAGGFPALGGTSATQAGMSSSSSNSLLDALKKALGGGNASKGGGGSSGGGGGLPNSTGGMSGWSGNSAIQAIGDFWRDGNNMLYQSEYANTDLAALWIDPTIPYEPLYSIDVSQFAENFNPYDGANNFDNYGDIFAGSDVFAGAGGSDFSIDEIPMETWNGW